MKNSILFLLVLVPIMVFSQSYTEKYNSLYNRYELYDSSNNLVSYKKYNSLYNRWEYYEVAKTVPTYQNLKPSDPTNWDLAYQALAYKQQKYDEGNRYVTSQIQKLRNDVSNSTTLSSDEKTQLQNSITNSINEINSTGKSDFSNSDVVNSILNYIYQNYNNTINSINSDRETDSSVKNTEKSNNPYHKEYSGTQTAITYAPILDKPDIVGGKKIGVVENNTVKVLEKINENFYKVKSGTITGYLFVGWFK